MSGSGAGYGRRSLKAHSWPLIFQQQSWSWQRADSCNESMTYGSLEKGAPRVMCSLSPMSWASALSGASSASQAVPHSCVASPTGHAWLFFTKGCREVACQARLCILLWDDIPFPVHIIESIVSSHLSALIIPVSDGGTNSRSTHSFSQVSKLVRTEIFYRVARIHEDMLICHRFQEIECVLYTVMQSDKLKKYGNSCL